MAKVPKHRRIKRATVLIKRSRCVRNTKTKSYSPLYQKLKVNNHSLARALSQEKQENQLLFSRNVELLAEVQDLVHACNSRDRVISNILKNAKDMMQMLVTMSGFLTNTISSCQEFVSNQLNTHRASTSSTGRRESTRRMSTKSPARGVVKPMVSGYTITKPTINLSRVNMQRLQNVNLSIIQEGPATPERNLERVVENRRSRTTLPERLPVSAIRDEGSDDEERIIVNRKTSRFSQGRLSSGRYSKRNSGRLSGGGGIAGRLSKRSTEYSESIKSPRVTLQDVSRYLSNNQSVNIRLLSESTNANQTNNSSTIEDTQVAESQSSPESSSHHTVIPETQDSCETSSSSESSEDPDSNSTVRSRKQTTNTTTATKRTSSRKTSQSRPSTTSSETMNSQLIDAMEGPSWMYESMSMEIEEETPLNHAALGLADEIEEEDEQEGNISAVVRPRKQNSTKIDKRASNRKQSAAQGRQEEMIDGQEAPSCWLFDSSSNETEEETTLNTAALVHNEEGREDVERDLGSSPVSSMRGSSSYFRVPGLPKGFGKATNVVGARTNGLDSSPEQDSEDDEDQRVNLCFITQRRGLSGRGAVSSHGSSGPHLNGVSRRDTVNVDVDQDEEEDDETLMLNMQRQVRHTNQQQQQQQSVEQPERLQFDMNELLQLTPLKPLLNMNAGTNNGPAHVDSGEPEPTVTVQLTQRLPKPTEGTDTFSRLSTVKIHQNGLPSLPDLPSLMTVRGPEVGGTNGSSNGQDRRLSELSTVRLSSRIELPRITDVLNITDDNHQQTQIVLTPESNKQLEVQKRKRIVMKPFEPAAVATHSMSEDNDEEAPRQRKKKPRQPKKKSKDKDPSTAKVVLQKLNETPAAQANESTRSDRKPLDESSSYARSSMLSRADVSSDSESSTASFSSKQIPMRPRRQKAPKNLQEPSLSKKLRR